MYENVDNIRGYCHCGKVLTLSVCSVYVCVDAYVSVTGFREDERIASYHNKAAVKFCCHYYYNAMYFTASLFSNGPLPPVKPLPCPT